MGKRPDLFKSIHHVCIVVGDIEKTEAYFESVGVGPWFDYPPLDQYTALEMPSREAFLAMRYRYIDLDNIQLQLCQPGEMDSPQRRFLQEKGDGVFHIGFSVASLDGAEATAAEAGIARLMAGRREDGSGFTYFDTASQAGVILEIRKARE